MKCTSCGSENVVFMKFNGKWQCTDCGAAFNAAQSSSANSVLNSHRNNSATAGTVASGSSIDSASAPSEVERLTEEIGESYKLAMQMASNGEFNKLEAVMDKMILQSEKLIAIDADSLFSSNHYCNVLSYVSRIRIVEGKYSDALQLLKRCSDVCSKFESDYADDYVYNSSLYQVCIGYFDLYKARNRLDAAKDYATLANEACSRMLKASPSDELALGYSAEVLANIGNIEVLSGNVKQAVDFSIKSLDHCLKLFDTDSATAYQAYGTYYKIKDTFSNLESSGNIKAADMLSEKICLLLDKLMTVVPDIVEKQCYIMHNKCGIIKEKLGDDLRAEEYFGNGYTIAKKLLDQSPNDMKLTNDTAALLSNLVRMHAKNGKNKAAVSCYRQAYKLYERLIDNNPADENALEDLWSLMGELCENEDTLIAEYAQLIDPTRRMLTEKGLRRQIRMNRVDLSEKLFKLNPNNRINLMRYGADLAAMGKLIWADSDEENTMNDKVRGYDAADGFFSKAVAHFGMYLSEYNGDNEFVRWYALCLAIYGGFLIDKQDLRRQRSVAGRFMKKMPSAADACLQKALALILKLPQWDKDEELKQVVDMINGAYME